MMDMYQILTRIYKHCGASFFSYASVSTFYFQGFTTTFNIHICPKRTQTNVEAWMHHTLTELIAHDEFV